MRRVAGMAMQGAGRRRWVLRGLAVAAAAALGFAGCTGYAVAASAERVSTVADVPGTPVAIVLGAEIYPDGTPSPFLRGRLEVAKALFEAGKVQAILVSGDNRADHYNEPDGMRNYLIRAGVPAAKVVADYAGLDTYDTCVRAKVIFGVSAATMVTQSYHLPRTVATCRAVGIDAWGVGDDSVRGYHEVWNYGSFREWLANVKMIWDVVSRRQPILGPRETSLDQAIKA